VIVISFSHSADRYLTKGSGRVLLRWSRANMHNSLKSKAEGRMRR